MADDQTSSKNSQEDTTGRPASKGRQMLSKWASTFIILPLIGMAISAVLLSRIAEWWAGPKAYHVYVVGDFSGQNRQIADELWKGISEEFEKTSINNIPVNLQRIDDKGSTENAKMLSGKLAERVDTLMVIGHMTSSKSLMALPAYLQTEPPIPVILPIETNPNLLPPTIAENHQYYPIFRFSPTDKEQAKTAAELALAERLSKENNAKRDNVKAFWIVSDPTNPTYSDFLINEFIAALQEKKQVTVLLSSSMTLPSWDILKNIDCIFFIGKWSNARVLLEQVGTLWTDSPLPRIILSDTVVEAAIFNRIQTETKLPELYITHPMPVDNFQKDGYAKRGRDIGSIVNDLLADTSLHFAEEMQRQSLVHYWLKQLFNIRYVTDARQVLRIVMERAAIWDNRRFAGELDEYVFNKDGLRENSRFHIWHLSEFTEDKNIFKEIDLKSIHLKPIP
ncbi:ABC transporter substrate-binding protein [Nitrosomonas sp. Nm166]|uniref:ABC transporter substrate-binding protein n=1 Tax=Nitrosomonas sp. Nm166 TaxID=1881054 RepID=UPI0008E266DE|nr:ABC transporter substrate-binding protein [Nitrosomonas sp. Nm166]SFE37081.1 branched-chain amino acid transport system substrate-binding protein [Nitrosomonas sp. Nm166]